MKRNLFYLESQTKKASEKVTENVVKMRFINIYEDETCYKNGVCSDDDDDNYIIPDQRKKNKKEFLLF